MATLQQQIGEKFLAQLAESKDISAEKIEKLRVALAAEKKAKAEDYAHRVRKVAESAAEGAAEKQGEKTH